MIFTFYFLFFAMMLFSLIVYVIGNSPDPVTLSFYPNSNDQFTVNNVNPDVCYSKAVFNNSKTKVKANSVQEDSEDIDSERKKQSQKLKRDLKTLNYIFILESRPSMINDPKQLDDIRNLKENLQRQIIKTTQKLNNYRLS